MEYGLRLSGNGEIPAEPRSVCQSPWRNLLPPGTLRALYFGTEFCEDLLPGADEAAAFCARARDAGIEAVLMTPVVTPSGLRRVGRLLADLARRGWTPTVTFNDWGVLHLLREDYPLFERKAGRLINRGIRDPRLVRDAAARSFQAQDKGGRLRSLLLRFGVTGVETDPDLEGCYLEREASGLQRTLHLPYVFAASGRNCLLKAEGKKDEESFTKGLGQGCPSPCRDRWLSVQRPDTDLPLWRAGNTLFYEATESLAEAHLQRCDRIVLHERPIP